MRIFPETMEFDKIDFATICLNTLAHLKQYCWSMLNVPTISDLYFFICKNMSSERLFSNNALDTFL